MANQINLKKSIIGVALVTVTILSVPLAAMQFTNEVDWSIFDFLIMGILIFSTGLSLVLVMKYAINMVYKVAMIMAFGTTFLLVWANLAVGLIGSGPHIGNLLYLAVYVIAIVGSIRSRFNSFGMERAMYATAVAMVAVAAIAIFGNMSAGSPVNEVIAVNGFFATLYAITGSLFRLSAQENSTEKSNS
jgi:hypothetical protein